MICITMRSSNNPVVAFDRWFLLCCMLILASSCASAEMTQHRIDETADYSCSQIHLNIHFGDAADAAHLTDRFVKQMDRRDLQTILPNISTGASIHDQTDSAILEIKEIDRHIETVEHRRMYGRASLTQMRGRKISDKPVISLRATLVNSASGCTVFQADYITQGPWHADSATVVVSLASKLVEQLEREGFIATND